MSGRLTQLLLALSLLLNAFALAGFIYRSWIAPPEFERHLPSGPGRPGGPLEWMAEDVGLDAKQRNALQDLFAKNAEFRRQHFQQIRKLREETGEELRKSQVDQVKLDSLIDQVQKLRSEVFRDNLHSILSMEAQLTPQQREKLPSVLADRFIHPPGRPGGPPPGPPSARPPQ